MDDSSGKEKPVQLAMHRTPVTETTASDLEHVFREHQQRVLRAAYRITGSTDDAQDVLQTVFLRLIRRDGGAGLSDNPASNLNRAANNAPLELVRSRQAANATP